MGKAGNGPVLAQLGIVMLSGGKVPYRFALFRRGSERRGVESSALYFSIGNVS
jgi:hypothetical protein